MASLLVADGDEFKRDVWFGFVRLLLLESLLWLKYFKNSRKDDCLSDSIPTWSAVHCSKLLTSGHTSR
jgi:hypothetical protein